MKIAVLSGKGGTGKTFITVNLATLIKSVYVDCDVEEPNGHLYFKPENIKEEIVTVKIPVVDNTKCDGCRKCVDFCKFNALAYIYNRLIIFEEICHSCGGCSTICPKEALTEKDKKIGDVKWGNRFNTKVYSGFLNIGEETGIPVIEKLVKKVEKYKTELVFIDCPPGSACSVMECVKTADYCILVTEPTIFGVHNLNMVYNLVKVFNKNMGVVVNKCIEEFNPVEKFCKINELKILMKIAYDEKLAEINSRSNIAVLESEKYRYIFKKLFDLVLKEINNETITYT